MFQRDACIVGQQPMRNDLLNKYCNLVGFAYDKPWHQTCVEIMLVFTLEVVVDHIQAGHHDGFVSVAEPLITLCLMSGMGAAVGEMRAHGTTL